MARLTGPSTFSTRRPQKTRMTRLNAMWMMLAWSRVAVSGVSQNGASEPSSPIASRPGMKAPQLHAHISMRRIVTISQQAAVTRAMPAVTRARLQLSLGLMPGGAVADPSNELDLLDLVIFVARGGREFDLLADLATDQRPAQR